MPSQSWAALVNQAAQMSVAGTTLSASTALTDVSPVPIYSTAAGDIYPGKTYLFIAHGTLVTAASAQGTLTLGIYYGGVAGVSLADCGTPTPAPSAVSWPWRMQALTTVQAVGATGKAWTQGELQLPTSLAAWGTIPIPNTTPAQVTIDTTIAKNITVGAKFSSATTNTLTCTHFAVIALN